MMLPMYCRQKHTFLHAFCNLALASCPKVLGHLLVRCGIRAEHSALKIAHVVYSCHKSDRGMPTVRCKTIHVLKFSLPEHITINSPEFDSGNSEIYI